MGAVVFSKKVFKKIFGFSGKGFIGPIGDDLPSLIPIVVALMLFFMVFSLTLNSYSYKNMIFSQHTELTSIARELKGDSLLLSVDQFTLRCDNAKLKRSSFSYMAAIYSANTEITNALDDFLKSKIGSASDAGSFAPQGNFLLGKNSEREEKPFFCGYKKVGSGEFSVVTQNDPSTDSARKKYSMRSYPVAVQSELTVDGVKRTVIVPGVMVMVIWNEQN